MALATWQESMLVDEESKFLRDTNEFSRTSFLRTNKIKQVLKVFETMDTWEPASKISARLSQLTSMTLGSLPPTDEVGNSSDPDSLRPLVATCEEAINKALSSYHDLLELHQKHHRRRAEALERQGEEPSASSKQEIEELAAETVEAAEALKQAEAAAQSGFQELSAAMAEHDHKADEVLDSKIASAIELNDYEHKVLAEWRSKKSAHEQGWKRWAAWEGLRHALRIGVERCDAIQSSIRSGNFQDLRAGTENASESDLSSKGCVDSDVATAAEFDDFNKKQDQTRVEFGMKLGNISCVDLVADEALFASLEMCLVEAVAAETGPGILQEHVSVTFSEGSLMCDFIVECPPLVLATEVAWRLSSAALVQIVRQRVASLPGIEAVASGIIEVSMSGEPRIQVGDPGRPPLLSDYLPENTNADPKEREAILKQNHEGSRDHPHGCRPCHFQGGLCWKGLACSFCHICPKPKRKSKHQRDVDKRRQERYRQVKDNLGVECLDELTKIDDSRRLIMTSSEELKKMVKSAYKSGDPSRIEEARAVVKYVQMQSDSCREKIPPFVGDEEDDDQEDEQGGLWQLQHPAQSGVLASGLASGLASSSSSQASSMAKKLVGIPAKVLNTTFDPGPIQGRGLKLDDVRENLEGEDAGDTEAGKAGSAQKVLLRPGALGLSIPSQPPASSGRSSSSFESGGKVGGTQNQKQRRAGKPVYQAPGLPSGAKTGIGECFPFEEAPLYPGPPLGAASSWGHSAHLPHLFAMGKGKPGAVPPCWGQPGWPPPQYQQNSMMYDSNYGRFDGYEQR